MPRKKPRKSKLSKRAVIFFSIILLVGSILPSLQGLFYVHAETNQVENKAEVKEEKKVIEEEEQEVTEEQEDVGSDKGELLDEEVDDESNDTSEVTETEKLNEEQASANDDGELSSTLESEKNQEEEKVDMPSSDLSSKEKVDKIKKEEKPKKQQMKVSSESVIEIHTAEDLNNIRDNLRGQYILMNDIDLSGINGDGFWVPIGTRSSPFMGTFDGNGHTIRNINIFRYGSDEVGLFSYTSGAVIRNVTLDNVDVTGRAHIGALIGTGIFTTVDNVTVVSAAITGVDYIGGLIGHYTNSSAVQNSSTSGTIIGTGRTGYVGGLIGFMQGSTISNASSTSSVEGTNSVGGLVGNALGDVLIKDSFATGEITGDRHVGGLVGYTQRSEFENSYATGAVSGSDIVGGLVGFHTGSTTKESFATGYVSSTDIAGGLIGRATDSLIQNSFATGTVEGSNLYIGGLIGLVHSTDVMNSYAVGNIIEGRNYSGGLIGGQVSGTTLNVENSYYDKETTGQDDEGKGDGKTTAEMQNISTYLNWDFTSIWGIHDGRYPHLKFHAPPAPPTPTPTGIIYVKEGSSGHGVSWADAFGTLQEALNIATAGDEIWIAEGTYVPTKALDENDERTKTFQMKNDVTIYGGFPANGNPTMSERDPKVYETILNGEYEPSERAYHVFNHRYSQSTLDDTAVLDGVTITKGFADGQNSNHQHGGGMYNRNANPTLRNVIFKDNRAENGGGAVYNFGASPTLTDVLFTGNISLGSGGAMANAGGKPHLERVQFFRNEATFGGAIANYSSSKPMIKNVTIHGNGALYGGGLYMYNSSPTLMNVLMHGNIAVYHSDSPSSGKGGAVYIADDSQSTFINSTITDNKAGRSGHGIYAGGTENAHPETIIQNSIIWGNHGDSIFNNHGAVAHISNSLIEGSGGSSAWKKDFGTDKGNNLDVDPMFVDPSLNDFRLKKDSPSIMGGNNEFLPADLSTDLDGNDRIKNSIVDIGAYEYQEVIVKTIESVEPLSDILVENGTTQDDIGLPTSVEVLLSDGTKVVVNVRWNSSTPEYDSVKAGSYEFEGDLIVESNIENPDDLKAKIIVTVKAQSDDISEEPIEEQTDDGGKKESDAINKDEKNDKKDNSSNNEKNKEPALFGKQLPNTATSMYTFMIIGLLIILLGMGLYLYKRKKVAH
ncbi:GLUG motif-containing protein [Virgibacillus sp. LDC-1]|uniref:GLUG motif-containing protein n=1 Tax=Virgibacillus sp. LDC-1 TaxID=3039856 RepID=UPI0024DEBDBC|nr:GLUG motif-containing protein [Virgibacillus sp. LDC-1]